MTKVYDTATDLITFARSSSGTALRRVGYGDELVTNGTFLTDTDWTKSTGWTINTGTGKAEHDGTGGGSPINQDSILVAGRLYVLTFDLIVTSGGGVAVRPTRTSVTGQTQFTTSGNKSLHFVSADGGVNFSALASFVGSIDNVSVKEVIFDRATDDLVLFDHPDDIPRIEYGSDGSLKGLLIEEQRTNLLNHSEDFSHSSWTLIEIDPFGSGSITNAINGPDGQTTADFIRPTSVSSNQHYVRSLYNNATIGEMYTISVYVKEGGYSSLSLRAVGTNAPIVNYNLATGTADDPAGTIQAVGNGWFRCSLTGEATATYVWHYVYPNQQATYTGDGTSGIYVYGAQIEEGSFPTSYIPTSGSQSTRSPDIASIPVSAFGYNQDAGTVVVEASRLAAISGDYNSILSIGTDTSNRIDLGTINDDGYQTITFAGPEVVTYNNGQPQNRNVYAAGVYSTAGLAFKLNSANAAVNGAIGAEDTSCTIPTVTQVKIGNDFSSRYLNGHIKSLSYYPRRLTDAQLQELTS